MMRTIIFNGHIYQNRNQFVEALLIENGVIITCGSNEEIMKIHDENTQVIDLHGKTVVPGFNDSHLHIYSSAVALASVDLYGLTSIRTIIEKGRQFILNNPQVIDEGIVWGRGWNQDYFVDEHRLLNRFDLDQISSSIPILFARACGHVVVCNTKALELANITAKTPQVDGGQYDIDQNGNPNGIFRENAISLLDQLKNEPSVEDVVSRLESISRVANSYGITSIQTNDIHVGNDDGEIIEKAYQKYASNNPTVRVYHQVFFKDYEVFKQRLSDGYDRSHGNKFNRYGPLKLFVDGSLGARTAYTRNPYADDPTTTGIICLTQQQVNDYVQTADEHGIQVAIHAIGDGAIETVLNSYQTVIKNGSNNNRHGIIHCQITDIPLLNRFKELDVLAYVQPIFLHYDMHIVNERVGKQLASTSYAFNTMEQLGLHVSYGTDSPVEGLSVMDCIHCAVNRQDLSYYPKEGFYSNECVDVTNAIDAYTSGSAYASFEEQTKGRLQEGFVADLVVLSDDIFSIPKDQIKNIEILMTMVDGRIVFNK